MYVENKGFALYLIVSVLRYVSELSYNNAITNLTYLVLYDKSKLCFIIFGDHHIINLQIFFQIGLYIIWNVLK